MRRRTLLVTAPAVALAGCLGDGDDGGDDAYRSEPPRLVEDIDTPVDEPATVPEEPLCGVCNMTPSEYPHANAQVAHADEARQFFCTPGCLFTYSVAVDDLAKTDAPVENAWARDANHEGLVRAEELYWVLDTDEDRGIDPMRNPQPYEEREDALGWVDDHADLSEDDVVEFDELTRADAEEYRAFYL